MIWFVTLIKSGEHADSSFNAYRAALKKFPGVKVTRQKQLNQTEADHFIIDDQETALDQLQLRKSGNALGIDVYATVAPRVKRKLLVADMEATIILDEMLDLLAERLGIGERIKDITARAMAGSLDFEQSLVARTRLLAGTPKTMLEDLCKKIRLTPGAKTLVQTMRASNAETVLVTGGYGIFAERVARECGFDRVVANHPVIINGLMTGELKRPICTAQTKRDVLLETCSTLNISPSQACCIGDGANDILMLKACGLPISYKGKPAVRDLIDLDIMNSDLTAALHAQGYSTSEFVLT